MTRRGLVLGGGGVLGAAWMIGALSALEEHEGVDARHYDYIVGTSAGSVVGTHVALQTPLDLAFARGALSREMDAAPPEVRSAQRVQAHDRTLVAWGLRHEVAPGAAVLAGLNAATGEYVDLVAAGIIDAAKVTRSALQNAASIAALFLTTEAVIADKPEKAPAMPAGDGGMGGMDF